MVVELVEEVEEEDASEMIQFEWMRRLNMKRWRPDHGED